MRFQRILGALAAFVFTSVLYAQTGQAPTGQPITQDPSTTQHRCLSDSPLETMREASTVPSTQANVGIYNQTVMRKLLEEEEARRPLLMTEKAVAKEIERAPVETVIEEVKARGVDFDLTPGIEKKLRKAKATDEVIEAVREAGPKVRANMAKLTLGPGLLRVQEVPQEQARGLSAIMGEPDPDKAIALVDSFTKQYRHSPLLGHVYSLGANAYQQKGDVEKVVAYTGYSLNFNPDNLTSLILRVRMLPQPQYLRSHAAYGGWILQEALITANRALQLIQQVPKGTKEPDADQEKRLAEAASQVHGSLGLVHLELASGAPGGPDKAELAKAEREFTTAVTTTAHPDPRDYYRMGEAYALDGKLDDAIQAFTKASKLGQDALIKTYASEQIAQMKKRKAQGMVASNPSVVRLK